MILQAEAERNKRAEIMRSEGKRVSEINTAQSQKLTEILKAEGLNKQAILVAEAQATALQAIDAELKTPAGKAAAQFLMSQNYI